MHPRPNGRPEEHQQARRRVPECANTLLTGSPFPHEHTPQPRTKEHPACGQTRCLGPLPGASFACTRRRHAPHIGARRCRGEERRAGNGDGGDGGGDDGGGGGADGRGVACESRAQTRVSIQVRANGSTSRDAHTWAGAGGHTVARVIVLAVQEDPPSPVPSLGPVRATGRIARSRAHALSGSPVAALLTRSRCGWFSRCLCAYTNLRGAKSARK